MSIFAWIVLGIIAGALARWFAPGKTGGGLFTTMLLGIAGSYVGGYLGSMAGAGVTGGGINLLSIGTATAGAFVLLYLYQLIKK